MAPTHTFHPLPSSQADNGAAITKLFQDGGPGTTVLLLQSTLYNLCTPINFCHVNTTLSTVGYPTFDTGKQAILETRGERESQAVNMINLSGTALKRVHIRGCRGWGRTKPESKEEEDRLRREGKLGWVEGGGALVLMGGQQSSDSLVEGCRLEDPRGWTACHVVDWSTRPKVLDNLVGPCGQEASGGPWADGLSVAGKDSVISGNVIFDATDGVDDFPFDRDFSNTRVVGNTIRTEGAYIRLGIGCGMSCWSPYRPDHRHNYGGHVLHNYFGPGRMGYGIGMSAAKDFTVLGNVVVPGTTFAGDLGRNSWNIPPSAFVTEWADRRRTQGCILQDDFIEGEVSWLIGVESGLGDKLTYEGGQLSLDFGGNSASGEGGIRVKGARWEVGKKGELLMRRDKKGTGKIGSGKVIWSSGASHGGAEGKNPVLKFPKDGRVTVEADDGTIFWDPTAYIQPYLDTLAGLPPLKEEPKKDDSDETKDEKDHPSVDFRAEAPFLTIRSPQGHIVYATSYEYPRGQWQLNGG
ncbi:hypothetical protein P7C70_g3012, partial [Phenoliferia sp. Uapishka_3]